MDFGKLADSIKYIFEPRLDIENKIIEIIKDNKCKKMLIEEFKKNLEKQMIYLIIILLMIF